MMVGVADVKVRRPIVVRTSGCVLISDTTVWKFESGFGFFHPKKVFQKKSILIFFVEN